MIVQGAYSKYITEFNLLSDYIDFTFSGLSKKSIVKERVTQIELLNVDEHDCLDDLISIAKVNLFCSPENNSLYFKYLKILFDENYCENVKISNIEDDYPEYGIHPFSLLGIIVVAADLKLKYSNNN
jgi:hypothetical protein